MVDASESTLDGVIWLGNIGIEQTKNLFTWSLDTVQDLYQYDWNNISVENFTLENCVQFLSYQVLTGL